MAITEGTQPVAKTWTGAWTTAQTTAAFVPESGALLVAILVANGVIGQTVGYTITDSLSGTWKKLRDTGTNTSAIGQVVGVWCRDSPGASLTVSATATSNSQPGGQLVVRTLIGAQASASQPGAVNSLINGSAAAEQISLAAGTGNMIYGGGQNWTANSAMTRLANTASCANFGDATNGDWYEAWKSAANTAGTATYGYSTSTQGMIAAAEILAAAAGGAGPLPALRFRSAPVVVAPFTSRAVFT